MIRYLEIPDLHLDPEWMQIFRETIFPAILRAARENKVDFCVFPGDVHNKNFYLSKEYNECMDFFTELMAICPCAGVSGTLGHETPAMYGTLEKLGFVLMRPGRVYGLTSRGIEWLEQHLDLSPRAILFGLPELIPSRIQQELGYPTHADYLREYVAPMRLQFESLPAILAIHGTISDYSKENEIDPKKRNAKVFTRTEDIEDAGITRTEAGHIHTPTEFRNTCGGYAGSWGEDWGCLGFVPAMNLVEIERKRLEEDTTDILVPSITRIKYGTPERRKITAPLPVYSPDVAYWLHATDSTIETVGGHPWGRVTHEPQRIESRRITSEQAEGATLPELFRLNDPTVDAKTLELVKELDKAAGHVPKAARSVSVDRVEIDGCIFWQGRSIAVDLASLPAGLTQIQGANGEGKSSLAAFCTPYPVVVGKDTKSGRPSAIKDFFTESNSKIEKRLTVNGQEHYHRIDIRGANTQSPKVECTLNVNGIHQLDRGTFDEMMAKCEELYGSYVDYLLTTFYVQPLQGKTGSSLMSATMTDIRDLVQAIAGIDREREHRTALDRVAENEGKLAEREAWLKGAEAFAVDVVELGTKRDTLFGQMQGQKILEGEIVDTGKAQRAAVDALIEQQKANEKEKARKETDRDKIEQLTDSLTCIKFDIELKQNAAAQLPANQSALDADDARIVRMNQRQEKINRDDAIQNEYIRLSNEYTQKLEAAKLDIKKANNLADNNYRSLLSVYTTNKAAYETIISHSDKPCEHCGEIPYADAATKLDRARTLLAALVEPIKPEPQPIPESIPGEPTIPTFDPAPLEEPSTINRAELQAAITAGIQAQASIAEKQKQLAALSDEIATLSAATYTISETIDAEVTAATATLETLRTKRANTQAAIAALEAQIKALADQIEQARAREAEIKTTRELIITLTDTLGRWKYIAVQLSPKKIPAMELDLVAGTIDEQATRNLAPYHDGAYSFTTQTQRMGKKDVVDAFDIPVHDNSTGIEKSFLAFSPGQKTFLNDAYVKALVRIRNQRAHITYSPIVSDEADSAVDLVSIPTFYAMQEAFYSDERVLVISHTPDAGNYISNQIKIKELIR
jgi:hypothetical protein